MTFQQAGWCTPPVYTAPWEVTLGNETELEPSNATLPIPTNTATESGAFQKYSTIVFLGSRRDIRLHCPDCGSPANVRHCGGERL